jgi:hypothetical protein
MNELKEPAMNIGESAMSGLTSSNPLRVLEPRCSE